MLRLIVWIGAVIAAALVVDRLLLAMEARGWLYYRRTRGRRGGAIYHMLEMHSIFEPGIQQVLELSVHEEQQEDESGAPPGGDDRHDESVPHSEPETGEGRGDPSERS